MAKKTVGSVCSGIEAASVAWLANKLGQFGIALRAGSVVMAGAVTAAVHFSGEAVTTGAAADPGIETTQDIGTYFTGYGFETDLATAAVDKVKIPKKWDDSFAAFNQVIQESDLDLSAYKGKTVEKWTLLCPQLSTGDQDTYCVLLVYKARAIGAYLLQKPSGEVTGLVTAAKAGADAAASQTPAESTPPAAASSFPKPCR